MNIALVDDLPQELERLTDIINGFLAENHLSAEISTFHSAEDFLSGYFPLQYTLVFMDIYMDGITGVEAARKLRESDKETPIVFLTTSTDHTFDAFDVHAYQYILKSPDNEVLNASVKKVLSDFVSQFFAPEEKFIFSSGGEQYSIAFSNLLYAQNQKNYVFVTDKDKNTYTTRMTFTELCDIWGKDCRFLQINRGIIINMDYISSFGKDTCELEGGISLPINQRQQKKLDQIRKNYVFSKLHARNNRGGER